MKTIAIIPARLNSSRLPKKMLATLGDKSLILATYQNVVEMQLFDEVLVATDSKEIFDEIAGNNGLAVMTRNDHESGTDRIAEVIQPLDFDLVVNVQGDEPFMKKQPLIELIQEFQDENVDVATLKMKLEEEESIKNPNNVKVIVDNNDFALYFSRSVIPYQRDKGDKPQYFKHIGVYAFRKQALLKFAELPMGTLEKEEKIECLRFLENGMNIKVLETENATVGIDTQEDLDKANELLQ